MPERYLPPWQDSMSDGCSGIPPFIWNALPEGTIVSNELFLNITTKEAVRAACVTHDKQYYYGGSELARFYADIAFAATLASLGVPPKLVDVMFNFVRAGGGPEFRQKYSWAFGGEFFQYSDKPAMAAESEVV